MWWEPQSLGAPRPSAKVPAVEWAWAAVCGWGQKGPPTRAGPGWVPRDRPLQVEGEGDPDARGAWSEGGEEQMGDDQG